MYFTMSTKRLLLFISICASVLINLPRVLLLVSNNGPFEDGPINISIFDTCVKLISVFSFSLIVLSFNLRWVKTYEYFKYYKLLSILGNVLILLIWFVVLNLLNSYLFTIYKGNLQLRLDQFIHLFLMAFLLITSRSIILYNKYKNEALEKEKLKQLNYQNQLAVLKSQINPHFLFNSLSSLNLLIQQNPPSAIKFVDKLAQLYRYILKNNDGQLTSIDNELNFLMNFVHLLKERFRDNITINIDVDKKLHDKQIPVLTLQLLIENVVKHNEISKERPLSVSIYNEDHFLIVKNIIQPRKEYTDSTNKGLLNLNSRLKLMLKKELAISKQDGYFIVKVPIN